MFNVQNTQMHSEQDKLDFSKRLKKAIDLAGFSDLSLVDIANKFNLRHPNKSVSPQAVHNWLIGAAIPTSDKIETLATWLKTSPSWLRYGRAEFDNKALSSDEVLMLQHFRKLPEGKQKAIISLLHEFQ